MSEADLAALDVTDDAPKTLLDLPDDALSAICAAITSDLCEGVSSLIALSQTNKALHAVATSSSTLSRCAAQNGITAISPSLALLDVIETVKGLGQNRIYFKATKSYSEQQPTKIRPGSSFPRLAEYVLLMRRHPTLTVRIEGHEGRNEGVRIVDDVDSGDDEPEPPPPFNPYMPANVVSRGRSKERCEAVRAAMLDMECLKCLDNHGNRVWGALPKARLGGRMEIRGWDSAVAEVAGWGGGIECCHCELFFCLSGSGVEVPTRGPHYAAAAAAKGEAVGWHRHLGLKPAPPRGLPMAELIQLIREHPELKSQIQEIVQRQDLQNEAKMATIQRMVREAAAQAPPPAPPPP